VGWVQVALSGNFQWDRAAESVRRKPLSIVVNRYCG